MHSDLTPFVFLGRMKTEHADLKACGDIMTKKARLTIGLFLTKKIQLYSRWTIKWRRTKKKTLTEDLVREWEKQTDHHWRTFQKEMTFTLIHPLTPLRLVALLPSNNDITHARRKCEWGLGLCWCSRRGVNKGRSDFSSSSCRKDLRNENKRCILGLSSSRWQPLGAANKQIHTSRQATNSEWNIRLLRWESCCYISDQGCCFFGVFFWSLFSGTCFFISVIIFYVPPSQMNSNRAFNYERTIQLFFFQSSKYLAYYSKLP